MKQSTFSAVMANSIKNLLQGYTKGIRFTAILTLLFTIGVGQMLGETIASWTGAKRVANTEYAPTTSQTDNLNAKLKSECALSTEGTGGSAGSYYGTWTNDNCIYVTGLNLSSYKDVSLTVYLRRRYTTCTASFYTSTDGSTYAAIALDTKTLTNTLTSYSISGIGSNVKAIKILITGGSGNLWLGTLSVEGTKAAVATQLDKPTNLKVSNVTTTEATLSWDAVTNASGYTVTVGSTTHNANTNSISLDNLTPRTTYKWSVVAKGNGSTYTDSESANGSDFTTDTPKKYTVTWMVDKDELSTEDVYENGQVSSVPTVTELPCGDKFVGWTKDPITTPQDNAPTVFTTVDGSPVITKATTFYAVFADYE